jgi:ABC-2 type transport system ATP-binding protein
MKPITIEGLTKIYRDRRRQVVALDRLDLQVESGEVFGFLGPNGAGKSTTIKTLVGLIRATAGTVQLFGTSVTQPAARRRIGFLPENPALYDFLTAREFLTLVGRTFGLGEATLNKETDRVLTLLDLRHAERRPIRGYSKGMVQRLGLAQTLLHDPDLYILDEPMSGIDPLGRALVKQIMLELKKRGKTVFFSTHVTADVEAVCDRVAVIVAGKLHAVNVVSELLEKGILGYDIHLSGCSNDFLSGFEVSSTPPLAAGRRAIEPMSLPSMPVRSIGTGSGSWAAAAPETPASSAATIVVRKLGWRI